MRTKTARTGLLLLVLSVGTFVTFTNNMMFSPLLLPLADEFGTSVAIMGQVATAVAIIWGISGPTAGPLSDRYGRRPILAGGMVLICASSILVSFAWDYLSLLSFRLLSAAGSGAFFPVAMAAVGDWIPPNRRGRAMSWVMLSLPVVSLVGVPGMALVAQNLGWRWTFRITATAAVLVCLLALWILPRGRHAGATDCGVLAGFREVIRAPGALSLFSANSIVQAGYSGLSLYVPAYLMQTYKLDMGQIAPVLAAVAIGSLVANQLGGILADRAGRAKFVALSQAAQGLVGLPLTLIAPGIVVSGVLAAFFGGFQSLSRPAYSALIMELSSRVRGTIAGVNAISNQSGIATGSAMAGLALSLGGYGAVGGFAAMASFIGASLMLRASQRTAEPSSGETGDVAPVVKT